MSEFKNAFAGILEKGELMKKATKIKKQNKKYENVKKHLKGFWYVHESL